MTVENPSSIPWEPNSFGTIHDLETIISRSTLGAVEPRFLETIRMLKNAFINFPEDIEPTVIRDLQKRIEVSIIADILRIGGKNFNEVPQAATLIDELTTLNIPTEPFTFANRGDLLRRAVSDTAASQLPGGIVFSEFYIRYQDEEAVKEAMVNGVVIDISLMSQGIPWGFGKILTTLSSLEKEGRITHERAIEILNENYGFAALIRNSDNLECGISLHIVDRIKTLLTQEAVNIVITLTDDTIQSGNSFRALINEVINTIKTPDMTVAALDSIVAGIQILIPNTPTPQFEIIDSEYIWRISTANNKIIEVRVIRPS